MNSWKKLLFSKIVRAGVGLGPEKSSGPRGVGSIPKMVSPLNMKPYRKFWQYRSMNSI